MIYHHCLAWTVYAQNIVFLDIAGVAGSNSWARFGSGGAE
jgi:hypothetical protein